MHNSLNERFFSFNSTVVIFRNLFRNDSGIIPEKDRNLLSFGVCALSHMLDHLTSSANGQSPKL